MHAPGTVLRWTTSMGGARGGSCAVRVVRDGDDGLLLLLAQGTVVHAAKTGRVGFWTTADAAAIRAEGTRVATLATRGELPFDGTWWNYRPPPDRIPPSV